MKRVIYLIMLATFALVGCGKKSAHLPIEEDVVIQRLNLDFGCYESQFEHYQPKLEDKDVVYDVTMTVDYTIEFDGEWSESAFIYKGAATTWSEINKRAQYKRNDYPFDGEIGAITVNIHDARPAKGEKEIWEQVWEEGPDRGNEIVQTSYGFSMWEYDYKDLDPNETYSGSISELNENVIYEVQTFSNEKWTDVAAAAKRMWTEHYIRNNGIVVLVLPDFEHRKPTERRESWIL